jgi:hypothetical protein
MQSQIKLRINMQCTLSQVQDSADQLTATDAKLLQQESTDHQLTGIRFDFALHSTNCNFLTLSVSDQIQRLGSSQSVVALYSTRDVVLRRCRRCRRCRQCRRCRSIVPLDFNLIFF